MAVFIAKEVMAIFIAKEVMVFWAKARIQAKTVGIKIEKCVVKYQKLKKKNIASKTQKKK